jgi:hypothetical protein
VTRDPRAALALLDRLTRIQPHGFFMEERDALRILSLAAIGQGGPARERAASFLRAHPKSPLADRVRLATGL